MGPSYSCRHCRQRHSLQVSRVRHSRRGTQRSSCQCRQNRRSRLHSHMCTGKGEFRRSPWLCSLYSCGTLLYQSHQRRIRLCLQSETPWQGVLREKESKNTSFSSLILHFIHILPVRVTDLISEGSRKMKIVLEIGFRVNRLGDISKRDKSSF